MLGKLGILMRRSQTWSASHGVQCASNARSMGVVGALLGNRPAVFDMFYICIDTYTYIIAGELSRERQWKLSGISKFTGTSAAAFSDAAA